MSTMWDFHVTFICSNSAQLFFITAAIVSVCDKTGTTANWLMFLFDLMVEKKITIIITTTWNTDWHSGTVKSPVLHKWLILAKTVWFIGARVLILWYSVLIICHNVIHKMERIFQANFWEAPYQNNFQILVSVFCFFFTMKRLVPNSSCEHRRVENQNLK